MNRYDLYEAAVQAPARQVRFLEAIHGGSPRVLGEEFSGPASLGRAWVSRHERRRAVCVDVDPEPLAHARRLLQELPPDAARRVDLREADVLEVDDPADVIATLNFCVCEWHTRQQCVDYLRHVRARLLPGGVFVADLLGGPEALTVGAFEEEKTTPLGTFNYTWEQRRVNALTRRVESAIHFRLPSGEELRDAFHYDWRLWSIPELRDAMHDAGFATIEIYTNFADVDEAGDLSVRALADAEGERELAEDWVVYVVGRAGDLD